MGKPRNRLRLVDKQNDSMEMFEASSGRVAITSHCHASNETVTIILTPEQQDMLSRWLAKKVVYSIVTTLDEIYKALENGCILTSRSDDFTIRKLDGLTYKWEESSQDWELADYLPLYRVGYYALPENTPDRDLDNILADLPDYVSE